MADPKFKKQLVTVPEKLAKEISTNIVVPASSIINKIGPAKFIKNIQKGNKPSPPGSVSATQLLNNKKNITDLQSSSKYKSLLHQGKKQFLNTQNNVQLLERIELSPDIIMLLNFKPAYDETPGSLPTSNAVNDLLNIQINLRDLSVDIMNSILSKLYENEGLKEIIEEKRRVFTENIDDAILKLNQLQDFFNLIDKYQSVVNFRDYLAAAKNSNTYSLPSIVIAKEVFKSDFGFTDNNINSFLNTKLLAQFIEELYMASAFYSYYFIPTRGTADRKNDFNHFSVLKQARIDIERAVKNPVLEPYPGLTSVLPNKKSEVIKLLALFVGRELTVSRALQDQSFTKKLEAAGIDYTPGDNLLLKVIGRPDNDILTPTGDAGSIVDGISLVDATSGELVLPFETKFVTTQESVKTLFRPGNSYTLKPVTTTIGELANSRTARLDDVVNQTQFKEHAELLRWSLLNVRPVGSYNTIKDVYGLYITPVDIFDKILQTFTTVKQTSGDSPTVTEIVFAILNEAEKNKKLKVLVENFFRPRFDNDSISYTFPEIQGDLVVGGGPDEMWRPTEDKKQIFYKILDIIFPKFNFIVTNKGNGLNKKFLKELFLNDSANIGIKQSIINTLFTTFYSLVNQLNERGFYFGQENFLTPSRSINHRQLWTMLFEMFYTMTTSLFQKVQFSRDKSGLLVDRGFVGNEPLVGQYGMSWWIGKIRGTEAFSPNDGLLAEPALNLFKARQDIINEDAQVEKLIQLLDFFEKYERYVSEVKDFISNTDNLSFISDIKGFIADVLEGATSAEKEYYYDQFNRQQLAISNKKLYDIQGLIDGTERRKQKGITVFPDITKIKIKKPAKEPLSKQFQKIGELFKEKKPTAKSTPTQGPAVTEVAAPTPPPVYKNDIGSQAYMNFFRIWLGTDLARQKDAKILSVGVPLGLTTNLKQKLELLSDNDKKTTINLNNQETDVIKVVVYKEDLEYEDIVFKPKEYIFELSRFVDRDNYFPLSPLAKYADGTGLNQFLRDNISTPAKALNDIMATVETYDFSRGKPGDIKADLGEFSEAIKLQLGSRTKELKKNHINHDMIQLYIRLLTGIDLRESNFPTINNMIYTPIDEDLAELFSIIGSEEELQTWAQLFGTKTILTNGTRERIELLAPKKYERIFNILVKTEDFPIDVEGTPNQDLLDKLWGEGLIFEQLGEYFLDRNKLQNISLERFYTKVSTFLDANNLPED